MRGGLERRRRRWMTAALATTTVAAVLGALATGPFAAAKPGVITNRQGQVFGGDITEDDKYYFISTAGGQISLDKRNVAKVDYSADTDNQYKLRHEKLAPADVKGRQALAEWANGQARPDLAIAALEEARQIEPTNRDVALQLDAVQRQMDLDRRHGKALAGARGAAVAPKPAQPATHAVASTGPATTGPTVEHRLLTADEINLIRQTEMYAGDRRVKVRFDHQVVKRYTTASGTDPKAFSKLSDGQKANQILSDGSPDMAKDVRILTDPSQLQQFKTKVLPIIAMGCASTACHGGTHAGSFALYPGNSTEAVYTNFYILQTYAAQINGVKYLAMDREVPERSLVLQFGLPPLRGKPPHPQVKDWRPRFASVDDPAFGTIDDWLQYALRLPQPRYGLNVSPMLPAGATTLPAVPGEAETTRPTTRPATRAAAHGAPLPRTANGAVTQPSR